jgi:hypothetical protein
MAEETTPNGTGEQAPSPAEPKNPDAAADAPAEAGDKPEKKPAARKPPKAAEGEAGVEGDKPAPKGPKKEKAPALEDKPFADFIQQDYLANLKESLAKQGVQGVDLAFKKQKIPVTGFDSAPECWQVVGSWSSQKQPRQFNIYFLKEDIQGPKAFSYSESGGKTSTLEPFLSDERRITLPLLVFGAIQRLNGQKWLERN